MVTKRKPKYTKKNFQVGQIVYIEQIGASVHYLKDTIGKITEEVVEKVGTKFVTTTESRYHLADGLVDCDTSKDFLLHLTKEGAEVSALERKLKKDILSKVKFELVRTLNLDELKTIDSILTSAEERLNGGLK
jgi:hypothetical protein